MQTRAIYDHTNQVTIPTTKTRVRNSFMWYAHYVFISALSVLTNKRYESLFIDLVHTPPFDNFPFNHPRVVSMHVANGTPLRDVEWVHGLFLFPLF